jgi:hypothetical protein
MSEASFGSVPEFAMLQSDGQTGQQSRKRGGGNPAWGSRANDTGRSGNPRGALTTVERRQRHDAMVAELAGEFGSLDQLSVADQIQLHAAADLALSKPWRHNDRVRTANALSRIMTAIRKRYGRRNATLARSAPPLSALMAGAKR